MKTLLIAAIIALFLATPALSRTPRPDCAPQAKHCKITWVSYSYTQRGKDQDGTNYVRTCHVPAHGQRWCGPWRLP